MRYLGMARLMGSRRNSPYAQMKTDPYLSETDVAKRWGMSQKTLQRWRFDRRGPGFLRIGRAIRYRLGDIEAFEQSAFTKCDGFRPNKPNLHGHENEPQQATPRFATLKDALQSGTD